MAVIAMSHTGEQLLKVLATGVNQMLMVTRLKIDIGKTDNCLVEERLDAVSRSKRRHGPWLAITESFASSSSVAR